MKKSFLSFVFAITMGISLFSGTFVKSNDGTESSKTVTATDEIVHTLGDTTEQKYELPNNDYRYYIKANEVLTYRVYAPETLATYSFAFALDAGKNVTIKINADLIPDDTSKETASLQHNYKTHPNKDWTPGKSYVWRVELAQGYYTFNIWTDYGCDIWPIYEVANDVAFYTVNYYVTDSFSTLKYFKGKKGSCLNQDEVALSDSELNNATQELVIVQFPEGPISTDDDIFRVDYGYTPFPSLVIDNHTFKFRYIKTKNELSWILPSNIDVSNIGVMPLVNGTLSVNGTNINLIANCLSNVNLSGNPTIFYTSSAQSISNMPVTLKFADGKLDGLYFDINKALNTITKEDSTSAKGSISEIKGSDGTISIIDSDDDTSTPEVVEFLKRGNSSYNGPKYSFKFKLEKKYSFVKNKDGNKVSSKSWVLIANNIQEKTGLADYIGKDLYQKLDGNDAVSFKFINLYINGFYQGVYELCEKAITESKKRANIPDEDGYTGLEASNGFSYLDIDKFKYDSFYSYCSNTTMTSPTEFVIELSNSRESGNYSCKTSRGYVYNIKEPSYPGQDAVKNLAWFVEDFEEAMFSKNGFNSKGKHYSEYLDLDSMATAFLPKTFLQDCDWMLLSTYFVLKLDDDNNLGKLTSGPLWDTTVELPNNDQKQKFFTSYRWNVLAKNVDNYFAKGDFMSTFYSKVPGFVELLNDEILPLANQIEKMDSSMQLNEYLGYADWTNKSQTFYNDFVNRIKYYEDSLSDETGALRGVTARNVKKTLCSYAIGNDVEYQWYKLGENGAGIEIAGATESSFNAVEDGTYYVVASGTALTGTTASSMVSNPVYVGNDITVHYDMQGYGSPVPDDETVEIGFSVTEPTAPTESGYAFGGWFTDASCTQEWDFENDVVDSDMTLYAKWSLLENLFDNSSISLKDNTWLNFYTKLTDDSIETHTFKYSILGAEEISVDRTLYVKKVNGQWRISVPLKPYQLADQVTVNMYDLKGNLICSTSDSVRDYAYRLLQNPELSADIRNAVLKLLDYGAAVQILQKHNVDNLANDFSSYEEN